MAKRILCEMKTCEFTGIEYPVPYSGNCFETDDSAALRDFKKEVLADRPEMKGRLKVMTVNSQRKAYEKMLSSRETSRSYLEWRAYESSVR